MALASDNALEFDPDTHRFTLGGLWVPNVTRIIDWIDPFPRANERALERGSLVHQGTELMDRYGIAPAKVALEGEMVQAHELYPFLVAYQRFKDETDFEPEAVEQTIFCPEYRYAGILDRIGVLRRIAPEPAVVEIKVLSGLRPAAGLQLAAQENAWRADKRKRPLRRFAVQLRGDGSFKLEEFTDRGELSVFLSALNIFAWRCKHHLEEPDGKIID